MQPEKQNIKILGLCESDKLGLMYKIRVDNNREEWVSRGYFIPNHLIDLVKFYENHLVINRH